MSTRLRKVDGQGLPKGSRPIIHGGRSIFPRHILERKHRYVIKDLQNTRDGFIHDLSGGKGESVISTARLLMVDRLISKLSISRLVEIYLFSHGILLRDGLRRKSLVPEPILQTWMSLQNSIRADVQLLGLDPKAVEPIWDASALAATIVKEDEERQAAKASPEAVQASDPGEPILPATEPDGDAPRPSQDRSPQEDD